MGIPREVRACEALNEDIWLPRLPAETIDCLTAMISVLWVAEESLGLLLVISIVSSNRNERSGKTAGVLSASLTRWVCARLY
jgi:hypothetical protein